MVSWIFERFAGGLLVVVLPLLRLVFAAESPLSFVAFSVSRAAFDIVSCMVDRLVRGPLLAMFESGYAGWENRMSKHDTVGIGGG